MGVDVPAKFTDESLARHLHVEPSRRAFRINRLADRLTRAGEDPDLTAGAVRDNGYQWLQCGGVEPKASRSRLTWSLP